MEELRRLERFLAGQESNVEQNVNEELREIELEEGEFLPEPSGFQ